MRPWWRFKWPEQDWITDYSGEQCHRWPVREWYYLAVYEQSWADSIGLGINGRGG